MIDRRAFLATIAAEVFATPLAAGAKPPVSIRHVGWLAMNPLPGLLTEFQQAMRELGHIEAQTYTLHERYAIDGVERLPALAAELTRLNVDVIVAESAVAVRAAQRATAIIPIVFVTGDPVELGFVHSLSRPDGNLTGIAVLTLELYPKRIQLLKDAVPTLQRLATLQVSALADPARTTRAISDAARGGGVEALPITFINRVEELDPAFAEAARHRADAVLVSANPFFYLHRHRIVGLARRYRLPALYEFRDFVDTGGLMCYGADMKEVYRHLGSYVDRIFKGARPSDLPVQQPTKFELAINLGTAKALGLAIPPSLLARADHVIQ